ncbi:DNA-binding protein WhiA [Corynebacterium sp. CCUG 65737]|uniref:DNA-binding protein WhiA n=1 Tax=Corynebacterium sp. CCUG 65737 TaxID=2823889 RepID=UPI002108A224|nr:DNA-binding protein WhiA [Corynebacterium sp. CCUG 65737]
MALTAQVKDELLGVNPSSTDARIAEATAMLRVAGEFDQGLRGIELRADFAERSVADHLAATIRDVCDVKVDVTSSSPGSQSRDVRYEVKVSDGARDVIRRFRLVTASGHPVVGLPRHIISGTIAEVEAAWRGAFLARGSLTEPGRTSALEVVCPRQETALALVGLARRLSVAAKTKETRGTERVYLRDGDAIGILLSRMGAPRVRLEWDEKRKKRQAKQSASHHANFDDANQRRSAQAAAAAAARVDRAMSILGDDVPEHLADAGYLRVKHRHASLEELGRLADPQMTKDAVAGRIRRLLSLADKRAKELGIPDTNAAVAEDS